MLFLLSNFYCAFRWTTLKLTSNQTYADSLQARAAGMAEGFITSELIYMHYMNTLADYCTNEKDYCTKLSKFVSDNKEWINNKIKDSQSTEKSYWHQVMKFFYIKVTVIYQHVVGKV